MNFICIFSKAKQNFSRLYNYLLFNILFSRHIFKLINLLSCNTTAFTYKIIQKNYIAQPMSQWHDFIKLIHATYNNIKKQNHSLYKNMAFPLLNDTDTSIHTTNDGKIYDNGYVSPIWGFIHFNKQPM